MHPTPYSDLNAVLDELITSQQGILGENFVGAYLQGSFAVGDFDQHSDVDHVIVIEQDLSDVHVEALQAMHGRIHDLDCEWAQHLEGSYFPREVLRTCARRGERIWYLDHGARSLIRSDHCNTAVVRATVREHGVVLAGPDPASLIAPIPVDLLRQEILDVMHGWGQQILADPEPYSNRFYQGFIVLNYSRMLRDLLNGRVGSKRAGAVWARANLDPRWMGLVDRAWDCRPDPARSVRQRADPEEMRLTLEFLRSVLEASKPIAAGLGIPLPEVAGR